MPKSIIHVIKGFDGLLHQIANTGNRRIAGANMDHQALVQLIKCSKHYDARRALLAPELKIMFLTGLFINKPEHFLRMPPADLMRIVEALEIENPVQMIDQVKLLLIDEKHSDDLKKIIPAFVQEFINTVESFDFDTLINMINNAALDDRNFDRYIDLQAESPASEDDALRSPFLLTDSGFIQLIAIALHRVIVIHRHDTSLIASPNDEPLDGSAIHLRYHGNGRYELFDGNLKQPYKKLPAVNSTDLELHDLDFALTEKLAVEDHIRELTLAQHHISIEGNFNVTMASALQADISAGLARLNQMKHIEMIQNARKVSRRHLADELNTRFSKALIDTLTADLDELELKFNAVELFFSYSELENRELFLGYIENYKTLHSLLNTLNVWKQRYDSITGLWTHDQPDPNQHQLGLIEAKYHELLKKHTPKITEWVSILNEIPTKFKKVTSTSYAHLQEKLQTYNLDAHSEAHVISAQNSIDALNKAEPNPEEAAATIFRAIEQLVANKHTQICQPDKEAIEQLENEVQELEQVQRMLNLLRTSHSALKTAHLKLARLTADREEEKIKAVVESVQNDINNYNQAIVALAAAKGAPDGLQILDAKTLMAPEFLKLGTYVVRALKEMDVISNLIHDKSQVLTTKKALQPEIDAQRKIALEADFMFSIGQTVLNLREFVREGNQCLVDNLDGSRCILTDLLSQNTFFGAFAASPEAVADNETILERNLRILGVDASTLDLNQFFARRPASELKKLAELLRNIHSSIHTPILLQAEILYKQYSQWVNENQTSGLQVIEEPSNDPTFAAIIKTMEQQAEIKERIAQELQLKYQTTINAIQRDIIRLKGRMASYHGEREVMNTQPSMLVPEDYLRYRDTLKSLLQVGIGIQRRINSLAAEVAIFEDTFEDFGLLAGPVTLLIKDCATLVESTIPADLSDVMTSIPDSSSTKIASACQLIVPAKTDWVETMVLGSPALAHPDARLAHAEKISLASKREPSMTEGVRLQQAQAGSLARETTARQETNSMLLARHSVLFAVKQSVPGSLADELEARVCL